MTKKNSQTMLDNYFNAYKVRADAWNNLKGSAAKIIDENLSPEQFQQHKNTIEQQLDILTPIENYWGFPGKALFTRLKTAYYDKNYPLFFQEVSAIVRMLMSNNYHRQNAHDELTLAHQDEDADNVDIEKPEFTSQKRPYFELLVVDSYVTETEHQQAFRKYRRNQDDFIYESVFVKTLEDAVIAVLFNYNIQSVVLRYNFPIQSKDSIGMLDYPFIKKLGIDFSELAVDEISIALARIIKYFRPEVDIFLVTNQPVENIAGKYSNLCRRIFYNTEDFLELHLNILRGIQARYETPFFSALKTYSKKPTGVFHAMPISRGKSIIKSHWIQDMGEFYGINIFLAETSATCGGLDSLLEPTGPLKEAQSLASRAFDSEHTFFATNGTSTCNKIVVQALVKPNDIVLVDRDCHKSHHYGLVLSGAEVLYLDSYPLHQYSMYGAVPLQDIKRSLLELKAAGKLHRVKMLLLTNCTFDGIVYNVERYMQECLAIKPDLVFLWDEAWFAFASFGPTYRQRTAMHIAKNLKAHYHSEDYAQTYAEYREKFSEIDENDIDTLVKTPLLPDPEAVQIRVYATQSTHKTLTSLRQGSMIHIRDEQYQSKVQETFKEAYMTHTSTSPNYQILASLDVGRRQVELEGFELVSKQVEMAVILRHKISSSKRLSKYFRILGVNDMIPAVYRQNTDDYYDNHSGNWHQAWYAWHYDDFVLDCNRITLYTGKIGVDGNTFKNEYLMEKYGIQINKTSRNTVLFMLNIGTTRSSIAYLLEVLYQIVDEFEHRYKRASIEEHQVFEHNIKNLTENLPPLPDFSYFHAAFRADHSGGTAEGKIRDAYFLAYDAGACEYLPLDSQAIDHAIADGRELVSSSFVTPYPPGFPVLVPGQVISQDIITFLRMLDVTEIHGFRPELGLRVFTEAAIEQQLAKNTA